MPRGSRGVDQIIRNVASFPFDGMKDAPAVGSLALLFDSIDEKATKAAPSLVLTPQPAELRTMEIARLFADIEEESRDNVAHTYDTKELPHNFCAVHLGYNSIKKQAHKSLFQQADCHLLADAGEASYYDLKERFAYLEKRMPKKKQVLLSDFTWARWKRMLQAFAWGCAYCGAQADFEQDHVVPIQRGGEDLMANILPACHACNASKDLLSLASWLKARGKKFRERATELIEQGRSRFKS